MARPRGTTSQVRREKVVETIVRCLSRVSSLPLTVSTRLGDYSDEKISNKFFPDDFYPVIIKRQFLLYEKIFYILNVKRLPILLSSSSGISSRKKERKNDFPVFPFFR